MRKLPGTVYRAKGVVYSTDAPQRRAVLQVVGRRVDISLQGEWAGRRPRTQIVVIGAANGIDPVMLGHQFNLTAERLSINQPPPRAGVPIRNTTEKNF
jgi:G3E family GTPase